MVCAINVLGGGFPVGPASSEPLWLPAQWAQMRETCLRGLAELGGTLTALEAMPEGS